jgi:glycosyltransferase involved in cell wall biosynthesis
MTAGDPKQRRGTDSGAVPSAGQLVSFVIPTLREYAFGEVLDRLIECLRAISEYSFEILVVDDSDPETQAKMDAAIALRRRTLERGIALRLVPGPHRGKGAAVRLGAQTASGVVIFVVDADLPVSLKHVAEFLEILRATGADVVIGERSRDRYPDVSLRHVLSGGLRLIQKALVFGESRFEDTQCGFKAFRATALRDLVERQIVDRGMYDLEYLYAATKRGLSVQAVPVEHTPELRPSRINLVTCLLYDPFDILRFKVSGSLGRYE